MDYLIKEKLDCSCGTSNTFYDSDTLKPECFCTSCGEKLENPNAVANIEEFAKKTLPHGTKVSIEGGKIWMTTHIAAEIMLGLGFGKNIKSLQRNIRELINKTDGLMGEKKGRIYRVEWPSVFNYINKKQRSQKETIRGKSAKEVAQELGISLNRLYKYLQNDDHPKYYGEKGKNNRWVVKER